MRTLIDHDQSTHYRTASVATGCRHSTPALLSLSRNYIGFEVNGGIRSLRSRFSTERYSDARYLNAEFSHTLGSGWVSMRNRSIIKVRQVISLPVTSIRSFHNCEQDPPATRTVVLMTSWDRSMGDSVAFFYKIYLWPRCSLKPPRTWIGGPRVVTGVLPTS